MTDDPRPGFNALRDKMLQHLEVHRAAKLEDLAQAAATFAYEALYLPGSPDVPHVQRTAPRRIYLCVSDDLDDRDEPFPEEVTWAADEAISVTVPYVRADLVNAGTAVADEAVAGPCPFCGAEHPMIFGPTCTQQEAYDKADRAFPIVRCRTCYAEVPGANWDGSCQSAITAWNRRAALAAPKAEAWQDISTAPKDGTHILLGYAPDETYEDGFVSQGYWMDGDDDGPDNMGHDAGFVDVHFDFFRCARSFGAEAYRHAGTQPTHWMPIPVPPAPPAHQGATHE